MKRDWVKTAASLGLGVVGFFVLWAAYWLACVIGVIVAIYVYHRHPIEALLGGVAFYYVGKTLFLASVEWPALPLGDGGTERRRIEAATGPRLPSTPGEDDAAARNRGTAAWLAMPVIAIVVFFAYLIFR